MIQVPSAWESSRPSYIAGYRDGYAGVKRNDKLTTELARRAYGAGYTAGQLAKARKARGAEEPRGIKGPLFRSE